MSGTANHDPAARPTPVHQFHRFKVGAFHCAVIYDGWLDHPLLGFIGGPDDEIRALHKVDYPSDERWPMDENIVYVDTGAHRIIVDTGMGTSDLNGPATGHMLANLAAAGVDPASIDVVILTHADPDHSFGLIEGDGSRVFPNARLALSRTEYEFWVEGREIGGKTGRAEWRDTIVRVLEAYRDRLMLFDGDTELLPGVSVIECAGHSPGHHAVAFESEGQQFVVAGDVAHHHAVEPAHPDWLFLWDFDPPRGLKSKIAMFERLADGGTLFLGYHFPWPGIGRLRREDDHFIFVPERRDA